MISIPVAASRARMLRPSRPMIRPLISSLSMWKTGDGVLDSRLRSQALDRLHDDALGLLVGGHLRFLDDLVDIA